MGERRRDDHEVSGQRVQLVRMSGPADPFEELRSTRRGDYRALYTIDEPHRSVTVVAVAHRRRLPATMTCAFYR
jgi:hypothetical protein